MSSEPSVPELLPWLRLFPRQSELGREPRLPLFLLPPLEFPTPFNAPRNWSRCGPRVVTLTVYSTSTVVAVW